MKGDFTGYVAEVRQDLVYGDMSRTEDIYDMEIVGLPVERFDWEVSEGDFFRMIVNADGDDYIIKKTTAAEISEDTPDVDYEKLIEWADELDI